MIATILSAVGLLFTAIGGWWVVVARRQANPAEVTEANTGAFVAVTGGLKEFAVLVQADNEDLRNRMVLCEDKAEAAVQQANAAETKAASLEHTVKLAFEYCRALLKWGHEAGLDDEPDPPTGLTIPERA